MKKPDSVSMDRFAAHSLRPASLNRLAIVLASVLLISACTTYRPLDRGATVPWAQAFAKTKGGPLDDNRYRVGNGDALSQIASRYGIRMAALAEANNIQEPYVLYPGEVLRIPPDAPAPSKRPMASSGPRIAQTTLPAVTSSTRDSDLVQRDQGEPKPIIEAKGERYVVAAGESLARIASLHGLRLGELVAANDIPPPYRIAPGQTLFIPKTEGGSRIASVRSAPTRTETAFAVDPPPPLSPEGFLWPVDGTMIGSFEQNKKTGRSGGVTIAARKGASVRAADNGVVAYAGEALSGYGRMVMLRHAEGYLTLYAHNDVMLVREGDIVRRGQPIAEVGNSGDVIESQLHFELRKGTSPIDPAKVLAGLPGRQVGTL